MKKIFLPIVIIAFLFACGSDTTTTTENSTSNETTIKDDKLTGFLLAGVYFFHGYGGANAVYDIMKSGSNYELNTKDFADELDKNYCEIMIFPFGIEQAADSKVTLEESWEIKDKATLMETLDYLKKSGHQDEFILYKKTVDDNGATNADLSKIGAYKDKEGKEKLIYIKNNYAAISKTGIKAWDYARYVNNVCLGYSAGYITKEEGEKLVADLLIDARSKYSNWNEYYADYTMGRKYWGGDKENDDAFGKTTSEMMEGDFSIYKYLSLK